MCKRLDSKRPIQYRLFAVLFSVSAFGCEAAKEESGGADASDSSDSTDGADATDGTDGMDAVDATDAVDAVDAVDATDAADGVDGVDALDVTDGVDALDVTDGVDATDGVDGGGLYSCCQSDTDCGFVGAFKPAAIPAPALVCAEFGAGSCQMIPPPGSCWNDEDCSGGQTCTGAVACPCNAVCDGLPSRAEVSHGRRVQSLGLRMRPEGRQRDVHGGLSARRVRLLSGRRRPHCSSATSALKTRPRCS